MEPKPLTFSRKEALTALLDDPSPAVRRALLDYLQSLGEHARDFLRAISGGPHRLNAVHARRLLAELDLADPVSEFRGFIRSLSYELETGTILLARTIYPDLDVSVCCGELDRMAARCRELMVEGLTSREICKVINRVLFHELGFRGNVEDFTDPDNSFINRVLERKTGLPVTLSIIYILVAERCGLRLEPVALPGHFVVGSYEAGAVFFIDPFDHGRFLSPEDLLAYLGHRNIEPDVVYLAPTTVRETLCRCCRNLAQHYTAVNNEPGARLFAGFVGEFETAYERNISP